MFLAEDLWLSTGTAAARLGVSRWTIRRLVAERALLTTSVRGRTRIAASSLESYLAVGIVQAKVDRPR